MVDEKMHYFDALGITLQCGNAADIRAKTLRFDPLSSTFAVDNFASSLTVPGFLSLHFLASAASNCIPHVSPPLLSPVTRRHVPIRPNNDPPCRGGRITAASHTCQT